jgi:predicted O-methyltransferase YrrM
MNLIDKNIYNGLTLLPKDTSGWNGNSEVFVKLITEIKPKTIIEVGTWKGQSAINMGKTVKGLGLNTIIHCVDTWLGAIEFWTWLSGTPERDLLLHHGYPQIYYQFLSNVVHNDLQDTILPFPNTSENAFRYFRDTNMTADLIYIDASHEEEDVYKDITNYFTLLNNGGIIFGDDYFNWPSVKVSIDRYVEEQNLTLEILENNFWVIRK